MRTRRKISTVAALLGAALLILPACTGADETKPTGAKSTVEPSSPGPGHGHGKAGGDPYSLTRHAAAHMPMTADALAGGFDKALKLPGNGSTAAADLRAGLTYLLTEHVYLAGIAVDTAYVTAPDSPEFKLAAKALDKNSVAIADAVGSIAGQDKRGAFLQSWRSHIDDFVAYAVAAKNGDAAGKRSAVKNLEAYQRTAGMFFEDLTGGALPASAVRATLAEHAETLIASIDAFAAGDRSAFDKLKVAADHMPMTAAALAAGVDTATKMAGATDDQASEVRALLNAELTEHVYLAGVAVFTAYAEGADSGAFKAAAATLDKNSVEIADAVTSLTDKATGDAFLQSWRSHIDDFVTYAVGVAEGDRQAQMQALSNLDAYAKAQGQSLSELTGGALPAAAVEKEFTVHIASLTAAIDALAAALI